MNIGEASKRKGSPVKTIRYYEDIGLVVADLQKNSCRDYARGHIQKLNFLKRAREFGFSLDVCRQFLDLYNNDDRASAEVKALAIKHLDDLKLKAA